MSSFTLEREKKISTEVVRLVELIEGLNINDVMKLLGTMFDDDFRRIRRWR